MNEMIGKGWEGEERRGKEGRGMRRREEEEGRNGRGEVEGKRTISIVYNNNNNNIII